MMKKIVSCFTGLSLFVIFCFSSQSCAEFKLGVENISNAFIKKICPAEKPCVVGLITNQTGVDQKGNRTIDILQQRGLNLTYVFAPEHGLNGVLAERDVHDSKDAKTDIPIISLYGNGSGKMISSEMMNSLDVLFFDIQDSGMRHYTYISTLLNTMKLAAEYNKPFVVLDRPNPLGSIMEGPLVEPGLISFISIAPIPLRHGMTIGELAWYFNGHVLEKSAQLHVVPMHDYNRTHGFMGTFVHQLSPNLQSLQSCYGYSFLGLFGEIEPFDVGVGTPMAFRYIGLPEKMHCSKQLWHEAQNIFSVYGVKSSFHHHTNSKTKKLSMGLSLEFPAMSDVDSFQLFIALLQLFKKEGIAFSFSAAFDKAVGTKDVQKVIAGQITEKDFFNTLHQGLCGFYQSARKSFLYKPFPKLTKKVKMNYT